MKIFDKNNFEDASLEIEKVSDLINENKFELIKTKREIEEIAKLVDKEEENWR